MTNSAHLSNQCVWRFISGSSNTAESKATKRLSEGPSPLLLGFQSALDGRLLTCWYLRPVYVRQVKSPVPLHISLALCVREEGFDVLA